MNRKNYNVLSLFSGAGGLDLGFEQHGFTHLECVEIDAQCVKTLKHNRPTWNVLQTDVTAYQPQHNNVDVLIGGPPCQGFSLGGNRDPNDPRNRLFLEMIRVSRQTLPRIVVIENVLNLRTMIAPWSGKNFVDEISEQFKKLGYSVFFDVFRVCYFGVPQTRRRFIFIAIRGNVPKNYQLPIPDINPTTIKEALFDLGQSDSFKIPNHDPTWGFKSNVHTNLNKEISPDNIAIPIRISRTGSDGYPIRSFDEPFPAIDTATVWGWAKGHLHAERVVKDRAIEKHVRNPDATTKLWRITADQMRTFTHREYARLQTFPDNWEFIGTNKRDYHKQIGNAVPVKFAARIAENVKKILYCQETGQDFEPQGNFQLTMALF